MNEPPSGGAEEIETLRGEISRLRVELASLRQKNQELNARINNSEFERPPHYS